VQKQGIYPFFNPLDENEGTEVVINGKRLVMVGSNNYLGLTTDERVKEAAIKAVEKFGSSLTGSRFLNGTSILHKELEEDIADFVNMERALVYSTGMQANLGTISSLVMKGDIVYLDKLNHASILDGARLGLGKIIRFEHNNMDELDEKLSNADPAKSKIIVVDGVFSMEGDIVDLPRIIELRSKYGFALVVDDAHSLGVMGATGRGTMEYYDVTEGVDLLTGTFSKSFASVGGFVAGPAPIVNYIQHFARSIIFSASLPPSQTAAVIMALKILREEPWRIKKLHEIGEKMRRGFRSLGFDTGLSTTPIIPIIVGEDLRVFAFWTELFNEGVFTNAVISPATPPGQALIRTSYIATHTDKQLDFVLSKFEKIGKKLGVI